MDQQVKTYKNIDSLNEKLWKRRFERISSVEYDCLAVLGEAKKAVYEKGIASAALNLAVVYFLNSRTERSADYLDTALQWFSEHRKEKGYVRSILLHGNIYESFGEYEKTLALWLEALKVAREINARASEGEACSQLGLVYFRLSNYSKALEYLESGLKIREELRDRNGMASSLNRIGMVLRQTKKYKESLDYYFQSLDIRKRTRQTTAIPWTFLGIANTYEDSDDQDMSLEYYLRGIANSDDRCKLQCMMGAGRIYSKKGRYDFAEEMLSEALSMAKKLKSLYLTADAYSSLSKHYERKGTPAPALEYYKLFQETRESLLSEEAQSRLRKVEISHAVEKSEQEKEIYRLKNIELKKAYDIIEEKNRDITASISYALRIQNALLPRVSEIRGFSKQIFILYLPKDVISGDFYWFTEADGRIFLAAGDCTGHGVPGALMSMLGISFLEEIIIRQGIINAGEILDELSSDIRKALRQSGNFADSKDGMDISLCVIDRKAGSISFAGANNNLYLIKADQFNEYKADRMPAGYSETPDKKFNVCEIPAAKGDIIYLYSDGYADQFGGPDNKKYKYSKLKETLLQIHNLPLREQKRQLEKEYFTWKGDNTQIDDVLLIGYRI